MSSLYLLSSLLFITASFLGSRLFLITIPFFCYAGVATYIYHPLNTNIKGYEYIIKSAIGFFAGAGSVEPGYTFIVFFLKSLVDNIHFIYVCLDAIVIWIIAYAYRVISASYFRPVSYVPLATIIASYFPILFVFQQRSGTALGIVLLAFAFYDNIILTLSLLFFSVSIHIQSLSAILFYPIALNLKHLLFFKLRIPRKLSYRQVSVLIVLIFILIPILGISISFFKVFALTQGTRYMGLAKYQGLRFTGFITLALCLVPLLRSLIRSRSNFLNNLRPARFDTILVATFICSLIINIIFSSNLHFATRFSRPFEFILLTLSLSHYMSLLANNFSRYILAVAAFSFLYFSWVY